MSLKAERKNSGARAGRLLIALVIGITSILVVIFIAGSVEVLKYIFRARLKYVFSLFVVSFGIILVDSLRTYVLSLSMGKKIPLLKALENSIFGFYVSAITPFSAGGQPFQIYHLTRIGLSVEEASAIVSVKFITSFTVSIVFGIVALLLYSDTMRSIPGVGEIMLFGVSLTIVMYVFFISLALGGRFARNVIASKPIRYTMAFLLRKDKEKLVEMIEEKVESYTRVIRGFFKSHPVAFIASVVLTVSMIVLILSTPYLAMRSVSEIDIPYFKVIGLQVAMNLVVYFLPTPGASGGVEGMFYIVFSRFADKSVIASALIIWRFFTYYLTIIVGNLFGARYLR